MARNRGEDLQNPDYAGPTGRAWNVRISDEDRAVMPAAVRIILGASLIEAPLAHPEWSCYVTTLAHLRQVPGVKPPKIIREGATHEFALGKLHPTVENIVDPENFRTLHTVMPPDMALQLVFPSDERALEAVELALQTCVNGELDPSRTYENWGHFFLALE